MNSALIEENSSQVEVINHQKSRLVLECKEITKTFTDADQTVEVLRGVNLSVDSGEMLAILGVSGAGKSTFLQILGGLDTPTSGQVLVSGIDINTFSVTKKGELRNRYLGFIYQFHHLLPEFTALENVAMPLLIRGNPSNVAKEKANEILIKVGLGKRQSHRLGELSGGERQRVAIARALVTEPVCVLADEPTGNLDKRTAMQVFELMLQLNQDLHTSFIVVTHDLSFADRMDRTLTLEQGKLM